MCGGSPLAVANAAVMIAWRSAGGPGIGAGSPSGVLPWASSVPVTRGQAEIARQVVQRGAGRERVVQLVGAGVDLVDRAILRHLLADLVA